MDNGNKEQSRVTAELYLGDKCSCLCLFATESGEVFDESRLRTDLETFEQHFASERLLRIAVEISTHSLWLSRLSKKCYSTGVDATLLSLSFSAQYPTPDAS